MRLQALSVLGAPFGARAPVSGTHAGAMLLERADIGGLLVNSAVDVAEVSEGLAAAGFNVPRESGCLVETDTYRMIWLSPRSWLIQCPLDQEEPLEMRIQQAFPDRSVHAARFTDYMCWLELRGSQSLELLQQGGFVSLEREGLPIKHTKRTSIAGIAAVVIREDESQWLIGVERSRARYFINWLCSPADESGPQLG